MEIEGLDEVSLSGTLAAPAGSEPQLREQGWAAGFEWAAEEARRGLLHPLDLQERRRTQIVIEHAQTAFGGRCRGRQRPFIRGFIQGVAQFWRAHGKNESTHAGRT